MTISKELAQKIERHLARLKELNSTPFKSDEEITEQEQLMSEISTMLANSGINSMTDYEMQKQDMDYNELELELPEMKEKVDRDQFMEMCKMITEKQEGSALVEDQLKELTRQEKDLKKLIEIANKRERINKLKEQLKAIIKENNYLTDKPDKNNLINIRKEKYKERLFALERKLQSAKTFGQRLSIRMQIMSLKMFKAGIKTRNVSIKTVRGIATVQKAVHEVSDSLGKLDRFSDYDDKSIRNDDYGFNMKTFLGQKYKKKEKKSKKKKAKQENQDNEYTQDYGFNPKKVVGDDFKL